MIQVAARARIWRLLRAAALAGAGLAAAAPAAAQSLGQGGGTDVPIWRVLGALLLCLLLAAGAAFALRARMRGGGLIIASTGRRLQLVERVRLNQHADLCIVRMDEREFLVAAGPHALTVLGTPTAPAEAPAPADPS